MARFESFFERTLIPETGGDPNGAPHFDPADPGGSTQWGLSARAHPDLRDKITKGAVTKTEARRRYYQRYYSKIAGIDHLDERFAFLLYDTKVHGTSGRIVAMIQKYLNAKGHSLTVDGIWGPRTLAAFSSLLPVERDQLWSQLNNAKSDIASAAAKAVMRTQRRKGLKERDYTSGFSNRLAFALGQENVWGA